MEQVSCQGIWGHREDDSITGWFPVRSIRVLEEAMLLRWGGGLGQERTHKLCTVDVEAIAVQVAAPITGHENATQFPIPSCVECVI